MLCRAVPRRYDEPALLEEVEKRLGSSIPSLADDLSLPPDLQARLAGAWDGHVTILKTVVLKTVVLKTIACHHWLGYDLACTCLNSLYAQISSIPSLAEDLSLPHELQARLAGACDLAVCNHCPSDGHYLCSIGCARVALMCR
jgi:hypothetical protein